SDEQPRHPIQLSAYRLAKRETTIWQFAVYTENKGLDIQDFMPSWNPGGSHPIVNVTWYDAARYANWLSIREGLDTAYIFEGDDFYRIDSVTNGYRLPTEAQWEYAARSGGKEEVFAGFSEESDLYLYGNFCDVNCEYDWKDSDQNDGYRYTAPTGSYKENGLGLYDM
ncbi:MAG: SUMF1/EgtB/PvdO family nonheme iron enzyme, partial [Calditrichaeota bacterium]|nr:SUMF1/EgtB/PvdO family nonheme iron enzyme [Calditrichota bacterium]